MKSRFKDLLVACSLMLVCFTGVQAAEKLPEGNVPDAVELAVLEDIYTTMGGTSWTHATNWPTTWPATATSADFATWYGIVVTNNDITQVYLPNNGLSGPIPSSIGDLTELFKLILGGNSITGSIPTSIGNLTKLAYLSLDQNQLTGSIPSQLGDATDLKEIYMYHNSLSGSLPSSLGQLEDLLVLDLSVNQLTGSIPTTIGNLTALTYLKMSNNQLSGSIPSSIGSLTGLTQLILGGNSLSGSIPTSIGSMTSLIVLSLDANQLTGSIPSELGNLTAVKEIYLNQNKLTGTLPSSLGNLANLERLYLDGSTTGNQITGSIPSTFGNLSHLIYLRIPNNQLSGELPSSLGNLDNLWGLSLDGNNLSGSIPSSFGDMNGLHLLGLADNNLTGSIPSSMANLAQLTDLYLHVNDLSGAVPPGLGSISTLTTVDLSHNRFTFTDLLAFVALKPSAVYSPQDAIDTERTVNGEIGHDLTLTTTIDRSTTPASTYQWFKWTGGIMTALNTESASGHTVVVPNVASGDEGVQFFYRVKNSSATNLLLTSNMITLHAIVCNTPSAGIEKSVEGYTYTFTPVVTNSESCTVSYLWDFGDGQTSPDATSSHVYNTTGTYVVSLTLSYQCGECESSATVVEETVEVENTSICTAIYCDGFGGVGIGTMRTQGFRLSVDGKIRASDIIKVYPQGQWADFVFDEKYKLRPLSEVEEFINANHHLPEIPSAKQVEQEGLELGSMDAKLLQKIEELTLYVIRLEKEVEELKRSGKKSRR